MDNPKYTVTISYSPARPNGQTLVNTGSGTQSMPTYSEPFFVASMHELKVTATGSTYETALDNVLTLADSANNPGNPALSETRYH